MHGRRLAAHDRLAFFGAHDSRAARAPTAGAAQAAARATTASRGERAPHQDTRLYFWNEAALGMIGSALTLNQSSIRVR